MRVGLGTGSTVAHLLPALARRDVPDVRYVATSVRTAERARALGLAVEEFDGLDWLDLAIDGADQVDERWWAVKGGGGAHTREKIVAFAAERFVVIVTAEKLVTAVTPPVPLELSRFGLAATLHTLPGTRLRAGADPTPDGGVLADYGAPFDDPAALAARLAATPGRGRPRPVRAGDDQRRARRRRRRRPAPREERSMRRLSLFVLGLALLAGCGESDSGGPAESSLTGVPWQVSAGLHTSGWEAVAPSITFTDGHASGSTGCNRFNASYKISGGKLTLGPVATTQHGVRRSRGRRRDRVPGGARRRRHLAHRRRRARARRRTRRGAAAAARSLAGRGLGRDGVPAGRCRQERAPRHRDHGRVRRGRHADRLRGVQHLPRHLHARRRGTAHRRPDRRPGTLRNARGHHGAGAGVPGGAAADPLLRGRWRDS